MTISLLLAFLSLPLIYRNTYLIVPVVYAILGVSSTPFSTALDMLNAASVIAQDMKTDDSATFRPTCAG
jgi:hypothetical protein